MKRKQGSVEEEERNSDTEATGNHKDLRDEIEHDGVASDKDVADGNENDNDEADNEDVNKKAAEALTAYYNSAGYKAWVRYDISSWQFSGR